MDDKIILEKLKQGSREALALLWQKHSDNVLNLSFRMLKDRDLAEDILMDVFVQVPSAIKKFRGESAINTWLFRLTLNACLMKLRANKRHRELESLHIDEIKKQVFGSEITSTEYDAELLEMGLNKLPADTRSMLWLKDAEGLDIKDLTEIYLMPEGTIKARLSRARNLIKNFIKEKLNHA